MVFMQILQQRLRFMSFQQVAMVLTNSLLDPLLCQKKDLSNSNLFHVDLTFPHRRPRVQRWRYKSLTIFHFFNSLLQPRFFFSPFFSWSSCKSCKKVYVFPTSCNGFNQLITWSAAVSEKGSLQLEPIPRWFNFPSQKTSNAEMEIHTINYPPLLQISLTTAIYV